MTQTQSGLESLLTNDDSILSPPLHHQQLVSSSKNKPATAFCSGSSGAGAHCGAQRGKFELDTHTTFRSVYQFWCRKITDM